MYGKVKTAVKGMGEFEIEIDSAQAFRLLCDSMNMSFVYKDDSEFLVLKNEDEEETYVYKRLNKNDKNDDKYIDEDKITYNKIDYILFDDRGELYLALYNLADKIFMNIDRIIVIKYSDID